MNNKLNDLARVEINIPVELDNLWEVDVKKSSLQIPRKVKILLKEILKTPTKRSKKTYTYKGKEEPKKYWVKREDEREKIITYEVRSDNDDLLKLLSSLNSTQKKGFAQYLRNLSADLPVNDILVTLNSRPLDLKQEHVLEKYQQAEKIFLDFLKKDGEK